MYYDAGEEAVPGSSGLRPGPCHVCDGRGRLTAMQSYLALAGTRLRQHRQNAGLSLVEMANELGVEPGDVKNMESGNFSLPCVIKGYDREHREIIFKLLDTV